MGGHSSGPSSYEIQKRQQAAEEAERKKLASQAAASVAAANEASKTGEVSGGEGTSYDGGALSAVKRKRGSTLAGEGEQTFGGSANLGG